MLAGTSDKCHSGCCCSKCSFCKMLELRRSCRALPQLACQVRSQCPQHLLSTTVSISKGNPDNLDSKQGLSNAEMADEGVNHRLSGRIELSHTPQQWLVFLNALTCSSELYRTTGMSGQTLDMQPGKPAIAIKPCDLNHAWKMLKVISKHHDGCNWFPLSCMDAMDAGLAKTFLHCRGPSMIHGTGCSAINPP